MTSDRTNPDLGPIDRRRFPVLDSLPLAVMQNIYGVVMLLNAGLLIRWFGRSIARKEAEEGAAPA